MDFWMSLATNDEEGQAISEMTVKKQVSEFALSFHLSDPLEDGVMILLIFQGK